MAKQTKKRRKAPSPAERERRGKQRSALSRLSPEAPEMTKELREAAARGAESREEALHVDSRDWREVKIQGREAQIVEAVESGDTARAKEILEEVRANAGGCDVCSAKPDEGQGYVLSTTQGRSERRWGHRGCLTGTADRWLETGREPIWTEGTSIFSTPNEASTKHSVGGT
ncbi:MAG TPA: hypothetical protein VHI31_07625 [Actinomycetota bacterium]|nr:hypothetical protein [Actinomycetota bacterium]